MAMLRARLRHRGLMMLVAGCAFGAACGFGVGEIGRGADRTRMADLEVRLLEAEADLAATPGAAMVPVAAEHGWQVAVFAAPAVHDGGAWAETGRDVGRFVHAASWIELEEHRQHDGIFLSGPAGLQLTGVAYAQREGDYELALHMIVAPLTESVANAGPRRLVTCYATVVINGRRQAMNGELDVLAGPAASRGLLIGPRVRVVGDAWHQLDARVACTLPDGLRGADVMLRLCWRAPGETGFQPIEARLPISAEYRDAVARFGGQ